MLNFKDFLKNEKLSLPVLLLISIISRFPFVLKGFGETDSANLAVSIIDFINHGEKGFLTNLYFIDVVPLYVVYIKFVMKLFGNNYSYLATVMNYTNAITGTLLIIPAYFLVKRLSGSNAIAFCTALTFIFVPSIYQSSIYGFPHLIALFLFITSLCFFLMWLDAPGPIKLIVSFITLASAILFKSDFILGSGAYFGLLCLRRVKEREKIIACSAIIILSLVSFWLLRRLVTGAEKGYTTSLPNFIQWFKHFISPLFSKSISQLIKDQVGPIAYGIGLLNFFMAMIALVFIFIKRKTDILVFILSWTALPTILWLLLWINSARHNMLSVLPFIMIIFLFLYEKAPKLMAVSPLILILGNCLLTAPSDSTRVPSGDLFKSRAILENRIGHLHRVAGEIAGLKARKIILTTESFRPYVYYEIFTVVPQYEMAEAGSSCYQIKNEGCIICTKLDDTSYLLDMINQRGLFDYTIVAPRSRDLDFTHFKTGGVNIYRYEG